MNVNWTYQFTDPAARELRKLPQNDQERIVRALRRMVDEPFAGDVRKLRGQGDDWRLRVGAWRIRFEMHHESHTVVVHAVRRRPDAYRD